MKPLILSIHASLPISQGRVVFLGDSITYEGQFATYIEAYFITRGLAANLEFINLGLPSETTSGLSETCPEIKFPRPVLSERLGRILSQAMPNLIFACYGMNDGIYLPFDQERFKAFQKGINELHDVALGTRSQIIFLTPPYFDGQKTGNLAYENTLACYSRWLIEQRNLGWTVTDAHGIMTDCVVNKRETEPNFSLANDGVHPNDLGHWLIAKRVLLDLGAKDINSANDANQMVAGRRHGEEILALTRTRGDVLKDAWLDSIGHKRPEMAKGLPLEVANIKAAEIQRKIEALSYDQNM